MWDDGLASVSDDSDEVDCSKLSRGGRLTLTAGRGCGQSGGASALSDAGALLRPWSLSELLSELGIDSLPWAACDPVAVDMDGLLSQASSPWTEGGVPLPSAW
jgi:hypothetical protein